MTKLILQPASDSASQRNLRRTVYETVEVGRYANLLTPEELSLLTEIAPNGRIRLWGAKPAEDNRNAKRWERVEGGDQLLFALGPGRALIGTVTMKLHNSALARSLWGATTTANGFEQTWEYIMVIDAPQDLEYDKARLNEAIGRKSNADIREFVVLSEDQSTGALEELGVVPQPRIRRIPDVDLDRFDKLDQARTATSRVEQALIRRYLMGGESRCDLCGREFPAELLVAAHIRRRSLCTEEERRDVHNNVMLACRFGCDELFERGWVVVDSQGTVRKTSRIDSSSVVREYAEQHLVGKSPRFWRERPRSRAYFDSHFRSATTKDDQLGTTSG